MLELPFTLLGLILELFLPIIGAGIVYKLLLGGVTRLLNRSKLQEQTAGRIRRWVRLVLRALYILTIATFITILFAIPVFYLASYAGKASKKLMTRTLLSRMGLDEAQQFSFSSLLRYTVMVLVLLIGLSIIGINLSALTVIFGVLGIGLGFGLQSVISNFFSGLVIIIRNDIGVSYASDVDRVLEVLKGVAQANPFGIPSAEPFVRLKEFGDSSINFAVFTWIHQNRDKYEAHHWNNVAIWRTLKDNGIEIPFPQRDLHMRS